MSGEKNNYEIFVKGGPDIASKNVKIPRGMLEYVAGKAGDQCSSATRGWVWVARGCLAERGPGVTSLSQVCNQLPAAKCAAFLPQV